MRRYSGFQINDINFGVEIKSVQEIIQVPKITRLPNAFPYIKGIFSLRGDFYTLFDLGIILGLGETKMDEESKCILLTNGQMTVGVGVSKLLTIFDFDSQKLKKDVLGLPAPARRFTEGYCTIQSEKFYIISISKLFISEELTVYL